MKTDAPSHVLGFAVDHPSASTISEAFHLSRDLGPNRTFYLGGVASDLRP